MEKDARVSWLRKRARVNGLAWNPAGGNRSSLARSVFVHSYVVLFFPCGHSPPIGSLEGVPVMYASI